MKSKISLIIPTKDEPYIGTLVGQLRKIFGNKLEIIVIEKGRELPKVNAKVVRQRTKGLGNAFLEALQYAHGEIIANMDGDGSHRVQDLKKIIDQIDGADFVIGSRFIRGGKTLDIQHRQFISSVARKCSAFVLGLKIEDMTSGFFAVKRKVLEKVKIKKVLGYKIIYPLAYKANQNSFKIKEVPIIFAGRQVGVSHVSIFKMSGINEVYNEIKMAILLRLGLY
jgi:glycosyltransferase involved in cell wall biosynthesis